ncbi:MAG: cupin domain-containing protein [Verrucomicrobiaceae bacterium]|jgi:cupin 2 domain-containing protein
MWPHFFSSSEPDTSQETFLTLHQDARVKIEHIASHGQASPEGFWYDQPDDEWVMLVQGEASLVFDDGRTVALQAGDHLLVPKHQRHRVERTSADALWLAVHIMDR